jgi:hypothetical protein
MMMTRRVRVAERYNIPCSNSVLMDTLRPYATVHAQHCMLRGANSWWMVARVLRIVDAGGGGRAHSRSLGQSGGGCVRGRWRRMRRIK